MPLTDSQFLFCHATGWLGVTREVLAPEGEFKYVTRAFCAFDIDTEPKQIARLDWFGIAPEFLANEAIFGGRFPADVIAKEINTTQKLEIYKQLGVYTHERLMNAIGHNSGDFERAQEIFNAAGTFIEWFLIRPFPQCDRLLTVKNFEDLDFGSRYYGDKFSRFVCSYIHLRERGEI